LFTEAETVPKRGVYCAWAELKTGRFPAMVNIGLNPTFVEGSSHPMTIEAHLILENLSAPMSDFYGETLVLRFKDRLRDERKFLSADELVAQIRCDIAEGLRKLHG
jgi:riboflavin kinase/FMN adenylyltransferase